jgi:two-component SAPR family response regulator
MLVFVLDDEPLLLRKLKRTIEEVLPEAEVRDFTRVSAAVKMMEKEDIIPDILFLDIEMPGISGMKFAEKIVAQNPNSNIIFCTSYPQYAIDAIQLHVEGYMGYLLKPITRNAVEKEISYITRKKDISQVISVKCFGNFDVFYQGEPIHFKRTKTKELFAFLIDRNGAGVTAKQICVNLWDSSSDEKRNINYLYQLFDDVRNTFEEIGAENVLVRNGYYYSLDIRKISCDYYDFLQNGTPKFFGEYMMQYSWAEETCALLSKME